MYRPLRLRRRDGSCLDDPDLRDNLIRRNNYLLRSRDMKEELDRIYDMIYDIYRELNELKNEMKKK